MFCHFFEAQGFDPLPASNASEAISLIRAFHPHLALVDINMPNTSGIELLEILRSEKRLMTDFCEA